jgi:hypothetical protein
MTVEERNEKIEWIHLIENYGKRKSLKGKSDEEIEKLYRLAVLKQTDAMYV